MSALGDYIHLYWKNYEAHGTTRRGEKNTVNTENYLQNRLVSVQPINQTAIAELQRRLKLNSQSKYQEAKSKQAQIQAQLIDIIYQLLYERVSNIDGVKRLHEKASGSYTSTLSDGTLTKYIHDSHWAASKSHKELMALHNQAQDLDRQVNQLIKKINSQKGSQSPEDLNTLISLFEQYSHLTYDLPEHTVGAIEKAIKQVQYAHVASQVAGKFGEMLVAICDDKASTLGQMAVAQFLQEHVKGDQRASIIIDKEAIADNRGDQIYTLNKDNQTYYIGTTQNKVDTQIQINDETINASVKSYAAETTAGIHPGLQQVNLLMTLIYLNSAISDFGNHWLNMHAINQSHTTIDTSLDDVLKQEIAFEALSSGNPLKQGVTNANVFVAINRVTGQVFVKSVKDILTNNLNSISGLNQVSQIRLNNDRSETIEDRITNVLNQAHQCNISVGINVTF